MTGERGNGSYRVIVSILSTVLVLLLGILVTQAVTSTDKVHKLEQCYVSVSKDIEYIRRDISEIKAVITKPQKGE